MSLSFHRLISRCFIFCCSIFRCLISRFKRSLFYLLLGFGISLLILATQAQAAGTMVLQFRDRTLSVSLSELRALAANQEISPELDQFLQAGGQSPEQISRWLTTVIVPPDRLRSSTRDFALGLLCWSVL